MPSEPASTVSFLHPFVRQLVAKAGLTLVERDILAASGVLPRPRMCRAC
ncbi:MAG: hypothetical protein WDN04_00425 [Rhodospirillales bacterium]